MACCGASAAAPKPLLEAALCDLAVNDVDVSENGVVVCASNDRTVRAWSVDGRTAWVGRHSNYVTKVRIGMGIVISGGTDKLVCGWRAADGEKLWECERPGGILSLCLMPGMAMSGCQGGSIGCIRLSAEAGASASDVLSPGPGATCWEVEAHEGPVNDLAASQNLLLSCSNDCMVTCREAEDGVQKWEAAGHASWVTHVVVAPGCAVSASLDKTVRCWALADGSALWVASHTSPVLALAIGNGTCISGTKEKRLSCWDLRQGTLQWGADTDSTIVALDTQEGVVLAGTKSGKLYCFHQNNSKQLWTSQYRDAVTSLCHRGDFAVSGSADKEVRCWGCR